MNPTDRSWRTRLGTAFGLGLTLLLGVWAAHLKDPHLLLIRPYETPGLLGVTGLLFIGVLRKRPRTLAYQLWLGVLLLVALGILAGEWQFRMHQRTVLQTTSPAARMLGAHFMVGYTDLEALRPLVRQGLIGGIFITQRNVAGRSLAAVQADIAELQALRRTAGLPPLRVATDQEGGGVSRLSPPLPYLPPLAALLSTYAPEDAALYAQAEAYGSRQGQALAALGVNINFSPVVDLKVDRAADPLDFHSKIHQRAISADPAITLRVALAYGRGLAQHGVLPTLKHFPGLGRITTDTHHFPATLDTPIATLRQEDWLPFREVARQSSALIMLAHVRLPEVDAHTPVSFSRAVVQDILRGEWQHDGLLITDDLTMAAAYRHGICTATLKALNAGVDLLLIAYDPDPYYETMSCALAAHAGGRLDEAMLAHSAKRLAR